MQAFKSRFTVATVFFLLAACGGSGSNPEPGSGAGDPGGDGPGATASGYLIGPRVSDLSYGAGSTSATGEFNAADGSSLTFTLGALELAETKARARLSIYDMAGSAEQYRFDKAVRIARLLVSLDEDDDARNGVQLSSTEATANALDWQHSNGLWEAAADSLVDRLSAGTKSLISSQEAMNTMATELRAEGESCSSELTTSTGFSIAGPRCADRARLAFWRDDLSPAIQQIQDGIDLLLNQQQTVSEWWAVNEGEWQSLLEQEAQAAAWISYVLAGTDVLLRQEIEQSLQGSGALSASLRAEIERWRDGVGSRLRARDKQERELSDKVLGTWLGYGFDQQALRSAMGVDDDSGWQVLIRAVAAREGLSTTGLRLVVVDQQVYAGLQLIDGLMEQRATWVTGGSAVGDGGDGSDGSGGGGGDGGGDGTALARVWRVAYEELLSGTHVEFTIEGSNLDAQLSLILAGCSNIQNVSGTDSTRLFGCDLTGDAGGRILQVIDSSDGRLLYESIVSVTVGPGGGGGDEPVVSSVSPSRAERSSSQLFSVVGQYFPLDMRFSLVGCESAQVQNRSATRLDVLCQLDDQATVRAGRIETADGELIYEFNVSPVNIDETLIRIVDVVPAAALEAETLEITLSGTGFGSGAQVESAACESIVLISRTAAEITFRCRNAQIGSWPVYVVSSQQTVLAPKSIQVRGIEAVVTGVSPLQAVQGDWVNIAVRGTNLSDGVQIELGACAEFEELDSTAVLRQFACTPDVAGIHQGRVVAGSVVLYRFDFTVEAANSSRVTTVSPTSSNYGEPLQLTFSGQNLPELSTLEIDSCYNVALLSATSSELKFSCTPQQVGTIDGNLLDPEGANLLSFSVNIVDDTDFSDTVVLSGVEPSTTYIDTVTTFTVSGEELPTSLVLSVEGCTTVEILGGHDRQRQFRCTPRGASGTREMKVYASDGGALLETFELQVTGNEVRVHDISPVQTAIGVNTNFRVSGQNLSSAIVMELEGCDARLVSSSSTEQRTYRCVPYGLPGTRTVRVRDRAGGVLLYSRSIEFLRAP